MSLEEHGLERLFYYGVPTPDLLFFVNGLMALGKDEKAWEELRCPETHSAMLAERHSRGGVEQVAQHILTSMNGQAIKFVENIYPYNGKTMMRPGAKLLHTCLWSAMGSLSAQTIKEEIDREFGDKSSVVFENAGKRKSLPAEHVHVVVDNKCYD